jgi:hypothetical protein
MKEVGLVPIIIALLVIVAFVIVATVVGNDSRDGNDWTWQSRHDAHGRQMTEKGEQ